VIGSFEPIVVFAEAEVRETSLLLERARTGTSIGPVGACYHQACYQEAHPEPPGEP